MMVTRVFDEPLWHSIGTMQTLKTHSRSTIVLFWHQNGHVTPQKYVFILFSLQCNILYAIYISINASIMYVLCVV